MEYSKQAISVEAQISQLRERGLRVRDQGGGLCDEDVRQEVVDNWQLIIDNERVPVILSVPVFYQVVGYAARNEFGYASRNSEGALRAEIWENLIRKSEKIQLDSYQPTT